MVVQAKVVWMIKLNYFIMCGCSCFIFKMQSLLEILVGHWPFYTKNLLYIYESFNNDVQGVSGG